MAALGWTNKVTGKVDFLCGGIQIATNFVLTAAHCVFFEGKLPNLIKIGGNKLNGTDNEDHVVKTSFIYPGYNSAYSYDDIAVLELQTNSGKAAASLWTQPDLDTMSFVAIGYGNTQFAGSTTPILQKVKLSVTQKDECEPYFKRERKLPNGIADSHICAGDPDGEKDTCQGDSGGPLLVQNKIAAGIISSGQACAGIPPALYTRISAYSDWISSILNSKALT